MKRRRFLRNVTLGGAAVIKTYYHHDNGGKLWQIRIRKPGAIIARTDVMVTRYL